MKRLAIVMGAILGLSLFGCDKLTGSNKAEPARIFVFMTDYQSAALGTYAVGDSAVTDLSLPALHTDVALRSYENRLYVVERFGKDAVIVFDPDKPDVPLANYSVGNGTNPQDFVVTGKHKAYVIRLQSANVLIVDPATGDSLGRVDLSPYADADGRPEAAAATFVDGTLYVALQVLDTNSMFWDPTGPGKVVAINASTNQVTDVFTLTVWNPGSIIATSGLLFVAGGPYGDLSKTGIDRVNITTKQVTRITEGTALGGRPNSLVLVPHELELWTSVSQTWPNGKVLRVSLSGTIAHMLDEPVSPAGIACGGDSLLVVCDRNMNAPGVFVYNAKTGAKIAGPIATSLPPDAVAFVE